MRYFATYFDKGFIRRAVSLYMSLQRHFAEKFTLYSLCFDEIAFQTIRELSYLNFIPIRLSELLKEDTELANIKAKRSIVEFYFSSTAAFLSFLFKRHQEIDLLTYLDSDIFFFSSPSPLFEEIGNSSISIISHRYPPILKDFEKNGIYNVSWVTFKRDKDGLLALSWWRERCLEWCYDRYEDGKYADQKYLDDWPERFSNVHVIENIGANLAPWNILNYQIGFNGEVPTVNHQPLIFFHFHGFKKVGEEKYDPHLAHYGVRLNRVLIEKIYLPYIKTIENLNNLPPVEYKLRGNGFKVILKRIFHPLSLLYKLSNNELIFYK